MNKKKIDLHVHTIYSDGSLTPKQVIELSKKTGVVAVAITDHDTTDGVEEAVKEGAKSGIEVIPGVELSSEFKDSAEEEIHILGYFIDWEDKTLQQKLKIFRQARERRAYYIFQKLNDIGIKIKEDEIFSSVGIGSIGRLHFAKVLVKNGFVKNIKDAFELYLGYGKSAYVPKLKLDPKEAISMILRARGVPVLAHPYFGNLVDSRFIKKLVNLGLKGIEVYYSKHPSHIIKELLLIAEKYDLLVTGGSDCHGDVAGIAPLLGTVDIPYKVFEDLKSYKYDIENYKNNILTTRCDLVVKDKVEKLINNL